MSATDKKDIRAISLEELKNFLVLHNEKAFRAKQIWEWIWKKSVRSISEMSNISKELRNLLNDNFEILPITLKFSQKSKDGTIKAGFSLSDGKIIEGVLIPSSDRTTACISSQVGCNLNCKFCATGKIKMQRNLTCGEIYDQVVEINKLSLEVYNYPLSNVVIMGMGEPLLNYDNVLAGIDKITSPEGLGMSPQRITLSTAGISKQIKQLADDRARFHLAISLHAADDMKRSNIMPINNSNSLQSLSDALRYFYEKTKTRVTFEYLLLKDFNDTIHDAKKLAEFCKIVPCKINLIEYNPVGDGLFEKSSTKNAQAFFHFLETKNLVVNFRKSKGEDIDAACGQLANKILNS